MRETYSSLLQTTKDLCIDDSTSSFTTLSSTQSFLANQINGVIQDLYSQIKNYKTQPVPRTFSTVADQIYYHYPPGLQSIESLSIAVGSENYQLQPVNSQEVWNRLQQISISSSTTPLYYFPRQFDFGIYPTPSAVKTGTIVGNFLPQRISVVDYTDGTVAIGQNSLTLTGTDTAFTSAMVGRWFCQADSTGLSVGNWYRISAFSSTTVLTLETYFEESALSGSSYIIGQSPEIPEELHRYIPFGAAAVYYSGPRRDAKRAQELLNYYYTGGFGNNNRGGGIKGGVLGFINEYKNKGRSNSQLNQLHKGRYYHWGDEAWATTLSEAA